MDDDFYNLTSSISEQLKGDFGLASSLTNTLSSATHSGLLGNINRTAEDYALASLGGLAGFEPSALVSGAMDGMVKSHSMADLGGMVNLESNSTVALNAAKAAGSCTVDAARLLAGFDSLTGSLLRESVVDELAKSHTLAGMGYITGLESDTTKSLLDSVDAVAKNLALSSTLNSVLLDAAKGLDAYDLSGVNDLAKSTFLNSSISSAISNFSEPFKVGDSVQSLMKGLFESNALSVLDSSVYCDAIAGLTNFYIDESVLEDDEWVYEDELGKGEDKVIEKVAVTLHKVSQNPDYRRLSDEHKAIFYAIVIFLAVQVSDVAKSMYASYLYDGYKQRTGEVVELEKKIETATLPEIKALVAGRVQVKCSRKYLKTCRVILKNGLALRYEPSMKSEVIDELPQGKLVEILDKSNRSWLFVAVELNGEIEEGWVCRRYTTYFK